MSDVEGTGSISIRVTKDEFGALGHCDTASGSLSPNVTTVDGQGKQRHLNKHLKAYTALHAEGVYLTCHMPQ